MPFARRGGEADDIGSAPRGELVALDSPRPPSASAGRAAAWSPPGSPPRGTTSSALRPAGAAPPPAPRRRRAEGSARRPRLRDSRPPPPRLRGVPARGVPARGDGAPDELEPRLASVSAAETHSLRFTGLSILVLVIGRRPAACVARQRMRVGGVPGAVVAAEGEQRGAPPRPPRPRPPPRASARAHLRRGGRRRARRRRAPRAALRCRGARRPRRRRRRRTTPRPPRPPRRRAAPAARPRAELAPGHGHGVRAAKSSPETSPALPAQTPPNTYTSVTARDPPPKLAATCPARAVGAAPVARGATQLRAARSMTCTSSSRRPRLSSPPNTTIFAPASPRTSVAVCPPRAGGATARADPGEPTRSSPCPASTRPARLTIPD